MTFHGQNKKISENIGQNPNMFITDAGQHKDKATEEQYIENL